jgi:putative membrane-bound dehydrogenase-like protein
MNYSLPRFTLSLTLIVGIASAVSAEAPNDTAKPDRTPQQGLAALDVGDGLEATIFAAEPMLLSPTNIDIDHRGRVWVCEVVNYRHFRNTNNPLREKGDRILILEDTDGDGKADSKKVFYQGRDIDSAHGICVLENRVIVSALDKVLIFTDEDGDDKADKKEILFSGISGSQHDHGIHAFVFGPDGKLYFNFGNEGRQVKDKNGKPIIDLAGNEVNDKRNPYHQGMVFRCNPDGSEFETLGWNFRNNWEISVDSFGTLWQSDNDDDGNRGVRINFVMEYGNYGYRDEMTAAGWREPRTGMHEEIPKRHWHLRDPGVVPNLLQTGGGSPTGILFYEGTLLPKRFHNQIIHSDAGPNVVRSYAVTKDGAGYKATTNPILTGARDQWFRPSDVCVAPDGSLFIADWYDPGVGGHRMGDVNRGRIFRITPKNHKSYKTPQFDFTTPEGAAEALKSPAVSVRYLAWKALHAMQEKAEPALKTLWESDNPRFKARALWLFGNIKGRGEFAVQVALRNSNSDIRIQGLRLARQLKLDVIPIVEKLQSDPSAQVRRECAIALRHQNSPKTASLWAELAAQHDGKDRWYLEALGIAADKQWDEFLAAWLEKIDNDWNTPAGRDIIWRSRAAKTPEYLAKIIADASVPGDELPRYMRAFDFLSGNDKANALTQLAFHSEIKNDKRQTFVIAEALTRLKGFDANSKPEYKAALNQVLNSSRGTSQFSKLVDKFNVSDRYPELLATAQQKPADQVGIEAIRVLLAKRQIPLVRKALHDKDIQIAVATAQVLGYSADGRAVRLLKPFITDDTQPLELRRQATRSFAKYRNSALELVELAKADKLDANLKQAVAAALHTAQWRDVKEAAIKLFPPPPSKNNKPLPPVSQLLTRKGDTVKGRVLFHTTATCVKCHQVNEFGKEVGPNLSEIGKKLSKQALYESILFPSAGISHNYETYVIVLNKGTTVNGIITSRTADAVTIKDAEAIARTFKTSEIDEIVKQTISLMPADLQKVMTAEELVNVVEYMTTLKKALKPAGK